MSVTIFTKSELEAILLVRTFRGSTSTDENTKEYVEYILQLAERIKNERQNITLQLLANKQ